MKIAGIGSVSGAIAHLEEFQCVIPRGKFDIFFLKNSFKMNGQSHNYQVQPKNISNLAYNNHNSSNNIIRKLDNDDSSFTNIRIFIDKTYSTLK